MSVLAAWPLPVVVVLVALSTCPVAPVGAEVMAKLTATPPTPFPYVSKTETTNGFASGVDFCPFWLLPDVSAKVVAVLGSTVNPALLPLASASPAVRVAVKTTPLSALR